MTALEIRLFGGLQTSRGGRTPDHFPAKRVKDLFSYLVLKRQSIHSRESLACMLWDGLPAQQARHCLNTALWRLRQVLGEPQSNSQPYLRVDSDTISFNGASVYWLDVEEFENRCQDAEKAGVTADRQAALYRQAVALYNADLLIECYDDWCLLEREQLRRLYLRALRKLLTYEFTQGDYNSAVDRGLQILNCDPLLEEVHRDLIRTFLAMRQPAAALRQYRACEDLLRRDLGVEPMPETRILLTDIVAQTTPSMIIDCESAQNQAPVRPLDAADPLARLAQSLTAATSTLEAVLTQLRNASAAIEAVAWRDAAHVGPLTANPTTRRSD